MAITNITDLTEIQASSLTDNDLIAVGTQSGWKKIKANSLGGGGGAEDFVIEFTITPGTEMTVTSETTFAQVYSAYQQGKNIKGTSSVTGLGDLLFYMTQINDSSVKLFTYLGTDLLATINGDSEGWSMTVHQ